MIYICIENKEYESEIKYAVKSLFRVMNAKFKIIDLEACSKLNRGDLLIYYGISFEILEKKSLNASILGIVQSEQLFGSNYMRKESLPENPICSKEYISLYYVEDVDLSNYKFEVLNTDIFSDVYFMLSRYEEYLGTQAGRVDWYGRFLGKDSIAFRFGFLNRPIVDEWAWYLKRKIEQKNIFVETVDAARSMKLFVTHDVDSLCRYSKYTDRIKDWFCGKSDCSVLWQEDPNFNVYPLAKWELMHGIKSSYYFIPVKEEKNADYSINSVRVKKLVYQLQNMGNEVGYHAGFYTADKIEKYHSEFSTIKDCFPDISFCGMRSHFLKSVIPTTYRIMERENILYDTTLAFPDMEGFRCGTCHPFLLYDLEMRKELLVWEIPLIFMDVTLKLYQRYTLRLAREKFIYYAKVIKKYGGVLTILWHNNQIADEEWKKWNEQYFAYILGLKRVSKSMNGKEIIEEYQRMNRRMLDG